MWLVDFKLVIIVIIKFWSALYQSNCYLHFGVFVFVLVFGKLFKDFLVSSFVGVMVKVK